MADNADIFKKMDILLKIGGAFHPFKMRGPDPVIPVLEFVRRPVEKLRLVHLAEDQAVVVGCVTGWKFAAQAPAPHVPQFSNARLCLEKTIHEIRGDLMDDSFYGPGLDGGAVVECPAQDQMEQLFLLESLVMLTHVILL
jgi:hypothetical protein